MFSALKLLKQGLLDVQELVVCNLALGTRLVVAGKEDEGLEAALMRASMISAYQSSHMLSW